MFTELEVQGLRELLNRIPWLSTAEALFLQGLVARLEALVPKPPAETEDPQNPDPLRPDPLIGY